MSLPVLVKQLELLGIKPGAKLLSRQHVPLIKIPSFTGGADGAFESVAPLDYAYEHCFVFFGENTLWVTLDEDEITIIDGNPAGFYYCNMADTTNGVVWNNTFVPAAGAVAAIPASPTAFADPIVGGAGFVGYMAFDKTNLSANSLGDSGVLSFSGLIQSTIDSGVKIEVGGVEMLSMAEIGALTALNGVELYAVGSAPEKMYIAGLGWVNKEFDLSVDNLITLLLESTNVDSVITLTNYALQVDNR